MKVPGGSSHKGDGGCGGLGSWGVLGIGMYIWFAFCYIMDYASHYVANTHIHFELEQDSMCIHVCIGTELKLCENISFSRFPPVALYSHWCRPSGTCTPQPVPKA